MTNTKIILATSGFLLPENSYFSLFKTEDSIVDEIFDRSLVLSSSSSLIEYFKSNEVYMSNTVNDRYDNYTKTKDFKDYMALLDIVIDILKDIEFGDFFRMQAANKNLSNMSFKFCLDVTSGKFMSIYNDYNILPFSVRFVINNNITSEDIFKNLKLIEDNLKRQGNLNWELFLSDLANNRTAFLTFYKFVFADYY